MHTSPMNDYFIYFLPFKRVQPQKLRLFLPIHLKSSSQLWLHWKSRFISWFIQSYISDEWSSTKIFQTSSGVREWGNESTNLFTLLYCILLIYNLRREEMCTIMETLNSNPTLIYTVLNFHTQINAWWKYVSQSNMTYLIIVSIRINYQYQCVLQSLTRTRKQDKYFQTENLFWNLDESNNATFPETITKIEDVELVNTK